jgi:hypothetical protein
MRPSPSLTLLAVTQGTTCVLSAPRLGGISFAKPEGSASGSGPGARDESECHFR